MRPVKMPKPQMDYTRFEIVTVIGGNKRRGPDFRQIALIKFYRFHNYLCFFASMSKHLIILTINSLGEFVNKKITFAQTIVNKNEDTQEQAPGYLRWRGNLLYWPVPYPNPKIGLQHFKWW
jgi:hypothetical protein